MQTSETIMPTLYQKAQTGKVKEWTVSAIPGPNGNATLRKVHGLTGHTLKISDKAVAGKNIGRANETTPFDQAVKQAKSDFKKKLDKGYVEDPNGESDLVLPMLAQKFKDAGHRIEYPAAVQRKLNGVRCLAFCIEKDGAKTVVFKSRKGKSYDAIAGHLKPHLEQVMDVGDIYDGELYIFGMSLQKIVRLTKKYRPGETEKLQYWIYDQIKDAPFSSRSRELIIIKHVLDQSSQGLFPELITVLVNNADEVQAEHDVYVKEGFEGIIIRNLESPYAVNKRSKDLQKLKAFQEKEVTIIDVKEGEGAEAGCAVFVVRDEFDNVFSSRPRGSRETRRKWFNDAANIIGKPYTIRYFDLSDDNVPNHNVGIAIRDYE